MLRTMSRRSDEVPPTAGHPPLDILDLITEIWSKKLIIFAFGLVFTMLSLVYLRLATYSYTAELRIVPNNSSGSLPTGLNTLALLAGVNIRNSTVMPDMVLFIESLKSRDVADQLSRDDELMHTIFASEWNPGTSQWRRPDGLRASLIAKIKAIIGIPADDWHPPGPAELHDFIKNKIVVRQERTTPVVTLLFSHADPYFAAHFLHTIYSTADRLLRRNSITKSMARIRYLKENLVSTTFAEQRQALIQALSDEEKVLMMANEDTAFVAEPIGQVVVSNRPTSPRPFRVISAAASAGFLLGIVTSLGLLLFRRTKI